MNAEANQEPTDRNDNPDVATAESTSPSEKFDKKPAVQRKGPVNMKALSEKKLEELGQYTSARDRLSALEGDVATKESERPTVSRPGAVSVAGSGVLNSLEAEVLAKGSSNTNTGATKPGAVHVSGHETPSGLVGLERDVAAKSRATGGNAPASRPGAVTVASSGVLNSLEAEVLAKGSSNTNTGATKPGAVHVSGQEPVQRLSPATALSKFEIDALAKSSARPEGLAESHTRTETEGVSRLVSLEKDKFTERYGAGVPARSPGTFQLERQILAKQEGKVSGSLESKFAPSALTQLDQDVQTKSSFRSTGCGNSIGVVQGQQRSASVTALSHLEHDVILKGQAAAGRLKEPTPGGADVASYNLRQLEVSAAAQRADQPPLLSSHHISQFEQDVLSKRAAGFNAERHHNLAHSLQDGLSSLEEDILTKQAFANGSSSGNAAELYYLEEDLLAKSCVTSRSLPPVLSSMRQLETQVREKTQGVMLEQAPTYDNRVAVRNSAFMGQSVQVSPFEMDGSGTRNSSNRAGPVYPNVDYASEDIAGAATGGIEAFVAENVVDATGVAVIMSEEEEEKVHWMKQKKRFCFVGILVVIAIILIVVIPLSILKKNASTYRSMAPSIAPSESPSSMPSMSPTSGGLSSLVKSLIPLSGSAAFTRRTTPQYLAAEWLAEQDAYNIGSTTKNRKYVERYALAVLYFSLNGPNWRICNQKAAACTTRKNSWLSSTDQCTWYGLTCANGMVVEFSFGK
jgi:hypothetical protein